MQSLVIFICLMLGIVACSSGVSTNINSDNNIKPDTVPYKLIYVTHDNFNGDLMSAARALGYDGSTSLPYAAADYLCQKDNQCPSNKTCKAMIATTTAYNPTVILRAANPLTNWVLESNTYYQNISGQVIGQTNENYIFHLNGEGEITLTNPVNLKIDTVWSGMNLDWSLSAEECHGWYLALNTDFGSIGHPNSTRGEMIAVGTKRCDTKLPLYCVEQ